MKSNWPNPELQALALDAVEKYGQKLLAAKPLDIQYYGVTVPTARFYAELLGALCFYESRFKTEETFVEGFFDREGKPVVSRGLLQLSKESVNGYLPKVDRITREDALHDPALNLRYGVIIMTRWISSDGVISGTVVEGKKKHYKGMARYWSPFRKPVKVNEMRIKMKAMFQPQGE